MKSIIQYKKECYVCGFPYGLEEHHCILGKNRHNAEEDGLKVWLCQEHHRGTTGVHGLKGKELQNKLKVIAEKRWCEYYKKTPEEFLERYKINYL